VGLQVAQEDEIRGGGIEDDIREEELVSRDEELVSRNEEPVSCKEEPVSRNEEVVSRDVSRDVEQVSGMVEYILPGGLEGVATCGLLRMDMVSEVQVPHHSIAALLAGDTPLVGAVDLEGDDMAVDPRNDNNHPRTCFLPFECDLAVDSEVRE